MKVEREEKKPENKEGAEKKEDASKKKGLKRWGAILPITATLITAGVSVQCGDPGTNEPPMWEESDGGATQDGDAKTDEDLDAGVDGDVDVDGGDVTDAGADEDLDAGVDGDVDVDGGDVTDAGADEDLDAGVDGDVDVDGADVGPDEDLDGSVETDEDVDGDNDVVLPCANVYNTEPEQIRFLKYEDTPVGGYLIRYVSAAGPAAANIDIRCEETGDVVALHQTLLPGAETVIELPQDNKKIVMILRSQNVGRIICDVVVEDL